ncbi:alpha/beta fold hydrolase [Labedella endophytica]|uniref:Alpha/beta hydrolase n=1 Tax=Labedella endophytica TaxID=1523160 RepID=A0A3S0X9S9_9MICO|nr:alpha/beta hydrolase [Labedella endophytica]RUR03221.1 alpha/beta hydrolase [Labedella endophytica]
MTHFLTTPRGDRVAYDRTGEGPALIFIAGAGPSRAGDAVTTETAERAAERGITTIVFDRLGRGETQADGVLDLDRELETLAALIEEAGGFAVLCGHSSGCSIALAAAVSGLPVVGLALWEAPIAGDPAEARAWATEFLRLLDAGELEPALEWYMKDMPPEWLAGAKQSPDYPAMVAAVVSQRADAESLLWAASAPHSELFAEIGVPVLTMHGEQTFDEMIASSADIAASIEGAVTKVMPGAHHSWEPGPMAEELARFTIASFAASR